MRSVDIQQNSEEWYLWRSTLIGASDSAAVLGVSPYKTAYGLWLEKVGVTQGFSQGGLAAQRGHEMEAKARASYELLYGDMKDFSPVCVLHPEDDWIGASLDGFCQEDPMRVLEIKYPSESTHQMALEGRLPDHYYCQVQHQLLCVPEAIDAHYFSFRDDDPGLVLVERDKEYQEKLLTKLQEFRRQWVGKTPPPLTDRDSLYCEEEEVVALVREYRELPRGKKGDTRKADIKESIVQLAGHPKVKCDGLHVFPRKKEGEVVGYTAKEMKV